MKGNARTYAALLWEALEGKSEREAKNIASRFHLLLKKRGEMKMAPAVLTELSNMEKAGGRRIATLVAAAPLEAAARQELAAAFKLAGYSVQEAVEPGVRGGIAAFLGTDFLVDATIRGRFHALWKAIS